MDGRTSRADRSLKGGCGDRQLAFADAPSDRLLEVRLAEPGLQFTDDGAELT